ncbi:MAG: class I SAM-dependent methyltransferase [Eubacterium sp.]|nr:class I SAM-dependent methyltransferase [Eubacterium sp.]
MNIKWNAAEYKAGFSFVHKYGEDLLELFSLPEGSYVCDLGCGQGELTSKLREKGYKTIGVDASEDMLKAAAEAYPDIDFKYGNALDFKLPQKADGIFSNAVFHWIDKNLQEQLVKNIADNLRDGGELVCEFGGKGCAEKVHSTLAKIFKKRGMEYKFEFYFPTIGEYAQLLEKYVLKVVYASLFDRPTPQPQGLSGWIEMFDKKPFEGICQETKREIINEAEKALKPLLYSEGIWYIDYVRIRIKAIKSCF